MRHLSRIWKVADRHGGASSSRAKGSLPEVAFRRLRRWDGKEEMMDRAVRGSSAGFVLSLLTLLALVSPNGNATSPRSPGPRDACPVCGMFVAPHPAWVAQIVSDDNTALFFDGCKDLFAYLFDPGRYGAPVTADRIAAIFVTGYYDQIPVPARTALFVAGSDVLGPMGAELIPLRDRAEAEEFLRDHHGASILRFDDVDANVLAGLH